MVNRNNTAFLILRLSIGILMLLHGIAKLRFGTGFIEQTFSTAGLPLAFAYAVYLGEVIAPIMMIIGFRTRIAALLIAATMLVVAVVAMPDKIGQLNQVGGWALELQGLFFFGSLALFFTGGGKYALSSTKQWD